MQDTNKEAGSFVTGFGMGLITGAAAYFLFATEQGKELRKRALAEWEDAQKTITKEAGVELPKRFRQLIDEAIGYFAESMKELQDIQEGRDGSARSGTKKKTDSAKRPSGRFKGL